MSTHEKTCPELTRKLGAYVNLIQVTAITRTFNHLQNVKGWEHKTFLQRGLASQECIFNF